MTATSAMIPPRWRPVAYYAAVVVGIALAVIGLGELLLLGILGWFDAATLDDMYPGASVHRMHVLAQAVVAWLIAVGILIQPWRSPRTLGPAIAALVTLVAYTSAAMVAGVFDPLAVIGVAALSVIVWAHPGRSARRLLPFRGSMLVLGAPLIAGSIALAGQQFVVQLSATSADPHAAIGHYGFTAAMAISLTVAALIGATPLPGRAITAWLAVGGALYYGLASIVFPTEASSLGVAGGAVALITAAAYTVGLGTSRTAAGEPAAVRPHAQPLA